MKSSALVLSSACIAACSRPAESVEVRIAPPPAASTSVAPIVREGVWPAIPSKAPPGTSFRTFHHETLHVLLALPAGAKAEESRLPYGHPVIYVDVGGARLAITFSSGRNSFLAGLGREPKTLASMPVERIARTPDNLTVLFRRKEEAVVNGWVRGAECVAENLSPTDVDAAFAVCASMRVPPPGRWMPKTTDGPFPPVPEGAFASQEHWVTQMYAGQFVGKVLIGPCPREDEIRADRGGDLPALERKRLEHGEVLVSREQATYEGATYRTGTTFWATREENCCVATIPEFFTPPTEAQIDYVARWCDSTAR